MTPIIIPFAVILCNYEMAFLPNTVECLYALNYCCTFVGISPRPPIGGIFDNAILAPPEDGGGTTQPPGGGGIAP